MKQLRHKEAQELAQGEGVWQTGPRAPGCNHCSTACQTTDIRMFLVQKDILITPTHNKMVVDPGKWPDTLQSKATRFATRFDDF